MRIEGEFPKSYIVKRFGGGGRDRTGDPLLAKQAHILGRCHASVMRIVTNRGKLEAKAEKRR
jgi:hypothetical protein